ncbi:hypothetical protein H072_6882 [Dactylellina haptotyla CBS 200.50]|uniref:RING-type E3 ubiquitin transferase n=1 Tax=Dactylellina haptotyla (strain CBS 200.50) TaxID=1284197 RepID=S8AE62_DACHA|nr:hypothetical protein H072_6882 [Dactylellina haptotyla CBS 200.50]
MADQATTPSNDRPERGNRGGNRTRGGRGGDNRRRGGGRGNSESVGASTGDDGRPIDHENRRGRGGRGRGGRGSGQARGGNQGHQQQQSQFPSIDTAANVPPPAEGAEAADATEAKEPPSPSSTEDGDICFICANPIQYHSIAPCNHMTCHICSLRMRALYKTKQCPHCRTNSDFVIFTTNPEKTFEEYTPEDIAAQDEALGIKYEGKQIRADTLVLLRYNCPEPSCDVACLGWPDLHRHVKNTHKQFLCDLCSRFKKVFTHEHTLFTFNALKKHERHGDDVPGTEDQSGFKGHPECEFCHKRFYGDDELFAHCKEAHERCFICDRNTTRRPQYFINWAALEEHFANEHYRCTDPECLEKKFIVFASEMDLKAHVVEEHPGSLSKGALKDLRKIDMAGFPDAHGHGSGSGSGSRGRGRGGRMQRDYRRDQQLPEPTPPDTGPLRRDEIAYQRTLAVQTAQSTVPPRMFGGQLTRPPPQPEQPAARPAQATAQRSVSPPPPPPPQARAPVRQSEAFPPLGALSLSSQPAAQPARSSVPQPAAITPTPQPSIPSNVPTSMAQKHEMVVSRATRLLNNDAGRLEKFKRYISSYNAENMSARDLIEAFWVLFDVRATDLATLMRELSELFEKEDKRRALLEAWNEWKAVNEDYPPMPGSVAPAPSAAGAGGARVLKLKSATNRNLKAGASPWSAVTSRTIERGGGSLAEINGGGAKIGVPGSSVTVAGKGKAVSSGPTPWASAVRNPGGGGSSSSAGRGGRAAPAATVVSTAEFPSLPKAPPKHAPVPRKGEGAPPASVWGSGPAGGSGNANGGGAEGDLAVVGTKGKGKKKQTIIQWG